MVSVIYRYPSRICSALGSVHILRNHVRGGVGGPGSLDYIDYALRGGWGGKHQNDYVLYDYFCTTNIQSY